MANVKRVAACIALLSSFATVAAEPITAQALMEALAKNRSGRADFTDRKYLSSLDRPLESSGELLYVAPSHFEKRTIKPKAETLIVDGDTLSIERNGSKRSISLSSFPEVAAFTDSLRATLAGDLATLSRNYRVAVDGTQAQWRMTLLPSDPKIAAVVSRVTVNGHADRIDAFEVMQADGSRSVTTLVPHVGG